MEKIDTPASQKISFNVVHDYFSDLNDKTPNLTTSLQPSIKVDQERKLIPRKAQSSALKGVKKEKSDIIEKKEVRLMEPNELGQRSPLKILEKNNSQIIDVEVNLSPELIKNEQKIETNNEEKEENIFSKKNLRKYNTAITDSNRIEPEPELKLEQEQEKNEIKPINREIKPKHNTYSFCEKKTENIKNSKLFSISQILNPLDKIDVENQTNLDWEENNQNLIFSNEEFLEKNDQKHWTFNQSKLNDFKNKLLEQDFPHLGKFTCITSSQNFIAVGTQFGSIYVYNHKNSNFRSIQSSWDDYQNLLITAIDISYDEELLIAGYATASIELFDLILGVSLKIFKNIHQTPIISIKFYNDNTKSLKYSKALSSENGSKLYRLSFEKGIFSYDCEKQLVLEKNCGQICQIELLNSAILKNNEKTVDHKIFAVASLIRIAIIQIEPKIQQVFILNKPESVKENFPPSISWTEGIFKCESNESSIILMTSWGNHYFLINLNQKKEKIDGILFQGQLIAHLEIKYCAIYSIFLSNRIFISLLENKKGILINLEDFDQISNEISSQVQDSNIDEILIKLNHPIFSYYSEFEYTEKIMFNSFIKDSENMALSCYLQSFTAIRNINKLFFIGEGEIFTIDLFTWKKYINSMINTGDRMSALNTIIKVYKGEEKYVAGIAEIKNERFELMREYSEIMAKDFLLLALKKLDQKNDGYETEVKRLILTVTEFLIETDNSEYLFIEIQQIFDEFALGEKFYENLEFFILNGKIKYMPEAVLQNVVNYFKSKGKIELIQRLIVSLDLKKINSFPLINLCLELHFFKALIYICTIYNQDFMTPLIKIFNLYETTQKKDEKEANDYGLRCLWYLRMCLKKENILGVEILQDQYETIIQSLVIWVFEIGIVKSLLKIDAKIFFDVIYLFFVKQAVEIVNKYSEKIKIRYPPSLEEQEIELIKNLEYPTLNIMISILYYSLSKEEEDISNNGSTNSSSSSIQLCFYYFIGKITKLKKLYIHPKICYEAVLKLLEGPTFLDNIIKDRLPNELILSDDEKELEKSDFLINIIKSCEKKITKHQMEEIIRIAEISQFSEVYYYVNYIEGDYIRCFEIFLNSKNKVFQQRLHDWLDNILLSLQRTLNSSIENKKNEILFKEMKELILLRLTELVSINSEKTHKIISRYNKNSEKSVIKYLSVYPKLQMEYLERIINARKNGELIDNDLLLIHIELLCKEENEAKLLNILKTREYPLNESLKLCKKYARNAASAFLLEKIGAIEEALFLYMEIFEEDLDKNFKLLENKALKNEKKMLDDNIMKETINSIINLCKDDKNYDLVNGEDLWFKLLDKLIIIDQNKIFQKLKSPRYSSITSCFKELLGQFFEEISKNIDLIIFLKNIREKYFELNLGYLKNTFMTMISNFSYERNILNLAKQLLAEANYISVSELLIRYEIGYYNVPFCLICLEDLGLKEKKIMFFCGHCYHRKCFEVSVCPICKADDKISYEKVIFKYKLKIEKIITGTTKELISEENAENSFTNDNKIKKNTDVLDKEKKEKFLAKKRKIDRLKFYDKNREEELKSMQNFNFKYKQRENN